MSLKIIFAATPDFAIPSLKKIIDSDHKIVALYTQKDKGFGRGNVVKQPPIKSFAKQYGVKIVQPDSLSSEDEIKRLLSFDADILVDVACGFMIPKVIIDSFKFGAINLHPSLLPRWRGASPIQSAIIAGDKYTGITIMQMDEQLDSGDVIEQKRISIENDDTYETLSNKLSVFGSDILLNVLDNLEQKLLSRKKQDDSKAIFCHKIRKDDGLINWCEDVILIERKIRAYIRWPVSYSNISGKYIRVFKAKAVVVDYKYDELRYGVVVSVNKNWIDVIAKNGILRILEAQLEGKRKMPMSEILKSKLELLKEGSCFYA